MASAEIQRKKRERDATISAEGDLCILSDSGLIESLGWAFRSSKVSGETGLTSALIREMERRLKKAICKVRLTRD